MYTTPRYAKYISESNMSGMQYRFVKAGSKNGYVALCGSAERAIGICMTYGVGSGESCNVALPGGGALLKTVASVTVGKYLISDASGKGIIAAAGSQHCAAIARETAAAGDIIPVEVQIFVSGAAESN